MTEAGAVARIERKIALATDRKPDRYAGAVLVVGPLQPGEPPRLLK